MDLSLDFRSTMSARSDLAEAERLLGCYQMALGHGLPNRLVAIQGLARMLEQILADQLDAEVRELVDNLASLTRRADELVRSLASIGRLRRELREGGTADPGEVATEVATEMNLLSPGRPIEYHVAALPILAVPRAALHLVLLHLLRNAVQSGAAGRPLRVELDVRRIGDDIAFRISDNGSGLDESLADRLFEPFRSSDAERQGLGLFLVRLVVAELGGAIRVQSEPGRGTTITVLLRVQPAHSASNG
jgi:signal transduction histidine kinase